MATGIGTFFKNAKSFINIRFAGYIRYRGNNRTFLNEHYTENKIWRQTYDLVFPRNAAGNTGLVLCIHGGAWVAGNKDSYTGSLFQVSEEKGVAAACLNYRYVSDKVNFDDLIDDISAALSAIKSKGAKYGVNFDKVLLTGISAGGHLSLLYAYTQKEAAPVKPVCVVELCGPTNFEDTFFYSPENGLNPSSNPDFTRDIVANGIGCTFDPADFGSAGEAMKKYSPVNFAAENAVPTVFGHGEQDALVPYRNALDLKSKLDETDVEHTFVSFPDSGHGCEDKKSMHTVMQLFFKYIDTYLK
ncbi:MAG: alpha/beta hydrolase [Clostridia bacterium]|nr:alpha/beta hydrolase [Clostridia bacterium]